MTLLSVTEVAQRTVARYPKRKLQTVRAAIKRDIVAGRLAAEKIGTQYAITENAAQAWIDNRRNLAY